MKSELSIIILNYNTKELLKNCLDSLGKVRNEANFEVIVPDNGSIDGSPEMVESEFNWVKKVIRNGKNLGFAAGNNRAKNYVDGNFVLFLNSDTLVPKGTLVGALKYIKDNKEIGALTCKTILKNGELDKDARRSFITPWIGLVHIFLKLDRIFPKSKILSQYWYGYISPDETHEIDALQGAFFLTRKEILDRVNWFDESYFLDGEDIDLSWKIKSLGWKNVYYPDVSITHLKGATKGKMESQTKKNVSLSSKLRFRLSGVDSMEKFYRKNLWVNYPLAVNLIVVVGIRILKGMRFIRTVIFG